MESGAPGRTPLYTGPVRNDAYRGSIQGGGGGAGGGGDGIVDDFPASHSNTPFTNRNELDINEDNIKYVSTLYTARDEIHSNSQLICTVLCQNAFLFSTSEMIESNVI